MQEKPGTKRNTATERRGACRRPATPVPIPYPQAGFRLPGRLSQRDVVGRRGDDNGA